MRCFGCGKDVGAEVVVPEMRVRPTVFCSPTCALRWGASLPPDDPLWEGVPLPAPSTDPGEWRRISGPPGEGVFVQHPHCMALHEPGILARNHWGNWGPPGEGVAKESDWPLELPRPPEPPADEPTIKEQS